LHVNGIEDIKLKYVNKRQSDGGYDIFKGYIQVYRLIAIPLLPQITLQQFIQNYCQLVYRKQDHPSYFGEIIKRRRWGILEGPNPDHKIFSSYHQIGGLAIG
jgi:hypothetical protein